jgi:hypothetical protein
MTRHPKLGEFFSSARRRSLHLIPMKKMQVGVVQQGTFHVKEFVKQIG